MASVRFDDVTKVYPNGSKGVSELNLEIGDGEFMVLVGPSGCGKTTALRMVAGLEAISDGELRIGDEVVNAIEPRKRDIAMVFQNYAIYPHMSVRENIAFPLRASGVARPEIRERVERAAKLLGLTDQLDRRPRTLSGGQRQRVAMGRAIVREPRVFLMDEPLSNLDAKLRMQMRSEIATLQQDLGTTTIYVTHDQVEAMTMGVRIAVMRKSVLQQTGPAQEVYDWPANIFVATFLGAPGMNLFQVHLEVDGGRLIATIGAQRLILSEDAAGWPGLAPYAGRTVAMGLRPEDLQASTSGDADGLRLKGEVRRVEALGGEHLVHLRVDAPPVLTDEVLEVAQDIDAAAVDALNEDATEQATVAIARFGREVCPRPGDVVEVTLAPERLRFFDLDSGLAVPRRP